MDSPVDDTTAEAGDALPVHLHSITAPNPGPLTLEGTNTYVIAQGQQSWVIDPGPRDPRHLAAVVSACLDYPEPQGVLVTHHHADHAAGATALTRQLSARSGVPVPLWAPDPSLVPGAEALPSELEGTHGTVGHVIHLPGHTADSIGVLVSGGRLLTGDTLLGGSPTVICVEDGGILSEHLQSLAIMRAMAQDGRIGSVHPGHGPECTDPLQALEMIDEAIAHREHRIEQVRRARTAGILTMERLLRVVYGDDLPPEKREAAQWNLRATLDYIHPRD